MSVENIIRISILSIALPMMCFFTFYEPKKPKANVTPHIEANQDKAVTLQVPSNKNHVDVSLYFNGNTNEEYVRGVNDTIKILELLYISKESLSFDDIKLGIKQKLHIK